MDTKTNLKKANRNINAVSAWIQIRLNRSTYDSLLEFVKQSSRFHKIEDMVSDKVEELYKAGWDNELSELVASQNAIVEREISVDFSLKYRVEIEKSELYEALLKVVGKDTIEGLEYWKNRAVEQRMKDLSKS